MVVGGVFERVHGWCWFLGYKDNMGRDGECLILIIWWDFLTELKLGAGRREDLEGRTHHKRRYGKTDHPARGHHAELHEGQRTRRIFYWTRG